MRTITLPLSLGYQYLAKPILFQLPAEEVHEGMTHLAERIGESSLAKKIIARTLVEKNPMLTQTILGMTFENPIGLSAGFDYEAKLTQLLPSLGFGFETIGTITNKPYDGNPSPILGRLPKSQSLMVNKGFKNLGAKKTIANLTGLQFDFPLGVSIGRTNSRKITTQRQSITDILLSFQLFEHAPLHHSYYELNISCPNLYGDITFYPPENLDELLHEIDGLHLSRPVFIKMPIEKTNNEVLSMLHVIAKHSPVGVIFGNLQKNRKTPELVPSEVQRFPLGNFSGRPTFSRSNELISLTYKQYKERFIIIGTGGVFSAEDAYEKILRGASLVQLITGMIFKGPQLISEINHGLTRLLEQDGFTHLSQARGIKTMNGKSLDE